MKTPSPEVLSVIARIHERTTDTQIRFLLIELVAEAHVEATLNAARVTREVAANTAKDLAAVQESGATIAYRLLAEYFEKSAMSERRIFREEAAAVGRR